MSKNNRVRRKHKLAQRAARKRRRRKTTERGVKSSTLAPVLHAIPNPFAEMSDDQRRLAITEIANKNEEAYQEALSDLRHILRSNNPLLVLSIMASYGLTVSVDPNSGITKPDGGFNLYPFHVEILQALSLQIESAELSGAPFGPDVVMQVVESIKALCNAQIFRQLDPDGADLPEDRKSVALAQQLIRGTTQAVRNWGYHTQVKRIARELYSPFDAQLLEARGFTASDVLGVFETILSETESRQTARGQTLANLVKSSGEDKRQLVENYHRLIGLGRVEAEQFIKDIKVDKAPFDAIWSRVLSHYDLRLPDSCTFSAPHLAALLGLEENRVAAILDEHALRLGSLREHPVEHLHLSNPVWKKPLIHMGDREYFCALPVGFFSFVIPCMEAILSPFAAAVSDRRAQYLESKVTEIVQRRFPGSAIKPNFKWAEGGTTYESDLIAFIDSFALVIECKSGKITPPALRGAPDRLRKHIQELIIDPNLQSLRLKNRLEFLASNPDAADPIRDDIGYDLSKVHRVVRATVCLEEFGPIQASLRQLEDTGWLPEGFSPCPTMNLADFETVFDILEHPVQILHYMIKREAIESTVGYLANELDLLGLYLNTLLDIGEFDPDLQFPLLDMAGSLDAYYDSLDAGVRRDKPRPAISPLFSAIFSQLEQRGIDRWTEMGVALNMFSPDDQAKITDMLAKLEKRVHRHWRTPGHDNMVICVPSKASDYALGYVMFKNGNIGERRDFMERAAAAALESDHVNTVIVIARNIDRNDAAYHTIALFGPRTA